MLDEMSDHMCEAESTCCTLRWGGYEYWIGWERLDSPEKLLHWVLHLSEKRWMDRQRTRQFVRIVYDHFGWKDIWP